MSNLFCNNTTKSVFQAMMLLCGIFILFGSCKNSIPPKNKPLDYLQVMRVADSLRNIKSDVANLRFIDSIYTSSRLTIKDQYFKYDLKRSLYYDGRHNYLMANLYADSMLSVLKGKENEEIYLKDYANAYQSKGDAVLALKRYDEAFENYFKGKMLLSKINDGNINSGYSARLAMNYYRLEKFKDAARFFIEAYRQRTPYMPKNRDELFLKLSTEQELLDNAGISFGKAGVSDSALIYFNKALATVDKVSSVFTSAKDSVFTRSARGIVYGNMGDVYYTMGDLTKAQSVWKQSIAINIKKGYENHDARLTQIKLANLYLTIAQLTNARAVLGELGAGMKNEQDVKTRLKWLKLEWDYQDKAGNKPLAYNYVQSYLRLKDSVDNADKNNTSGDMSVAFKVLEQQRLNEILKNDNKLKQLYLFIVILLAGAAFIIALLVGKNWRRTKKNVTLLTGFNKEISDHNSHITAVLADLEQSHEDNKRMMKIVAHDLRNPVGNIKTIAGMLLEQIQIADEHRELLQILQMSSSDSLDLINSLLHTNTRNINMAKEPQDIYNLLSYCVALMKFKADEKQQHIVFESAHHILMLNREKMWRVLSNLIANAIKFSAEGSTIDISTAEKSHTILITVKDSGIGIPDELKDRIFDMFTLAKRKGTANEEPYGMGLAIARQIVEAHDGNIWFESQVGARTTFYVELPKI